jgi:hypothetical protein
VVLDVLLDVDLKGRLVADEATQRLLLEVDTLSVDIQRLESEVLFARESGAEHLEAFLTDELIPRLEAELDGISILDSVFRVGDVVVLLDGLQSEEQLLTAGVSVYRADDPFVDNEPPDTQIVSTGPARIELGTTWSLTAQATDDRPGTLLFSVRVDDGAWSSWEADDVMQFEGLSPGVHRIEVRSRDRFHNNDESPSARTVEVEDEAPPAWLCHFRRTGSPRWHVLWLLALPALWLRRRRRA